MIYAVLLILAIISISCLFVGMAKSDYKCKAIADLANTLIMLILLVINITQGNPIWCYVCAMFTVLSLYVVARDINDYEQQKSKKKVSNVESAKSVLKEFIKEIEEYGSRRH